MAKWPGSLLTWSILFVVVSSSTPGRVLKLAQDGALNLSSTSLLILDAEQDSKGETVLTLAGPAEATVSLLIEHAQPHLTSAGGGLRIALY